MTTEAQKCAYCGVSPSPDIGAGEPVAWLVKPQPNFRWHFCLKKEEAEHVANNMRTYANGCTGATIEPLYAEVEPWVAEALQRLRDEADKLFPPSPKTTLISSDEAKYSPLRRAINGVCSFLPRVQP